MSHSNVPHYVVQHPAHDIGETWMDKMKRLFRFRDPGEDQGGRKAIDPTKPYGHWAAGWEPVTMPGQKNPVRK